MASVGFAETNASKKETACLLSVAKSCVFVPAQSAGGHVSLLII